MLSVGASTITFDIIDLGLTPGGDRIVRLAYDIQDLQLPANHELDIRFDPAVFQSLFNPVGGPGLDLLVLQPNNPPGVFGDFSILALIDNPALSNLRIDVILASQDLPASQPFFVNELDPETFQVIRVVESGVATFDAQVPESSTFWLAGLGFLFAAGTRCAARGRKTLCSFASPAQEQSVFSGSSGPGRL